MPNFLRTWVPNSAKQNTKQERKQQKRAGGGEEKLLKSLKRSRARWHTTLILALRREAEAGGFLCSKPAKSTERVPRQPGKMTQRNPI